MIVAKNHKNLIGFITIRNRHHISLLFVDKEYHMQGVGRTLVEKASEYLITEMGVDYLTVDSAPYALEFYHKLGYEYANTKKELNENKMYIVVENEQGAQNIVRYDMSHLPL